MAGILCIAQTVEVALTAATAKTVLQVKAAANQRLRIKRWGVFFDGVAANAEPVQVRLLRQSNDGTISAITVYKQGVGSETIQTSAGTLTAEATAGDVIDVAEVHPQSGYEVVIPFDMPIEVQGGTALGIECTAPADVNVRAKIIFEE